MNNLLTGPTNCLLARPGFLPETFYTTGLNFITDRPRAAIQRDLAYVLEQLYEPKNHYQRVALTTSQLRTSYSYKPSPRQTLKLARAFLRIATTVGLDRETGPLFWKALLRALRTNRGAIDMVVGLAVMHSNYAQQSKSYVAALRRQAEQVDRIGEATFNARSVLGPGELVPPAANATSARVAVS